MRWTWWVQWIFLDNKEQDDYVKYDLSKLALGNNFALEFSVRGGALKRSYEKYFLSTTNVNEKIILWLNEWNLIFWKNLANSVSISNSILNNLESNSFYKIFAISDWTWKISLILKDFNWNIISSSTNTFLWNYMQISFIFAYCKRERTLCFFNKIRIFVL